MWLRVVAFQERLQESNKNNHGPRDPHKNLAEPMEAHKTTAEKTPAGMTPCPERTGYSADANPLKTTTWRGLLGFWWEMERPWLSALWGKVNSMASCTLAGHIYRIQWKIHFEFSSKGTIFYNKFSVLIFFLFNTTNTTLKYETIRPLLNR